MSKPNTSRWHSGKKPSDIVVEIGDRTFNCHRDALTRVSRYFRDELRYGSEDTSKIVIPEGVINADAFENVLKFIYKEVPFVPRTIENVDHLLRAADFLRLPVRRFYKSIIQEMLPYSFMFRVLTFARTSGRECFWHHIADYVSLDLGSLCEAFGFVELPLEDIKLIIELCPLQEDIVVDAIVDWISHNRGGRWRYFNELSRLGMMTGVSSIRMKSIAKSILPDGIPGEGVLSFLENLKCMSTDRSFTLLWESPIDEPSPQEVPTAVAVSIDQSIESCMFQTNSRIARMKTVALDNSHYYILNFTLLEDCSNRRGILEFFCYIFGPMQSNMNQLTPPSTHALLASHYDHFQMCGLWSTKRIYLCASGAKHLYVYDCDADQWRPLYFEMALKWATMTACDTNNAVYLLGGDEHNGAHLFALDPSTEEWSDLLQPSTKKYTTRSEMCALNGKLYIYHDTYRAYEIYDPKTNEWADSCKNPYANVPPTGNLAVYGEELWLFAATGKLVEEWKKKNYMAYIYRPESNSWRAYLAMRPAIKKYEKEAHCTGFRLLDATEL